MFNQALDTHETMMSISPQGTGHTHGGQSQFLPGYLLGDHAPHGMASPKLWSTAGLSPVQKSGFMSPASQSRYQSRSDSGKGRSGAPPAWGLISGTDPGFGVSPSHTRSPAVAAVRATSPGPPTSGLLGTPVSLREGSFSQSTTLPISPSQLDPFYTQGESLRSDDVLDETWVTIFGFPPGATSFILQQFSQYGNILKHIPSVEGNWMHVHYQSKLQAKKALSKNGKLYGGRMMIGVLPCIDKSVMEEKENVEQGISAAIRPLISPLETSSIHSPVTALRPLAAAYSASRSEFEVLRNKTTLQKDNSIVSKVKEYMFGW